MKPWMKRVGVAISSIRLMPHLIVFLLHPARELITTSLVQWSETEDPFEGGKLQIIWHFLYVMTVYPAFRNLFYFRIGKLWPVFLAPLCRPMQTFYIHTRKIGEGFYVQHGFSTTIGAAEIGKNFKVYQQVTIGYTDTYECPTIGDNVVVTCGAKVLGNVHIGDNVIVGANAVVVKDVPPNCTVAGVPARIIRRNGVRCDEKL